ncbi:terminase large subunit domain-containing protein [Tsukamurella paurometabola]|uniref:Phage terminase-like protein, large subunit n=1 Tax=Tsukamurella paurometabola TaxID=2061 RepID=A0A3P8MC14_TSUPA|nr:terminase large subunit [Tsukamurella paurometabola]UEA82949.1 terminase large subunit [Tsukamurella paurometabola]VDR40030.1 Phage terminase-like protein, large subunit [Tsukamurella paurometabola]
MKAGPKGQIAVEPLDFSGWPDDLAERIILFIETYLVVPKGAGAGELVRLAEFQKEIIRGAFAEGIRQALVSIARANGKTGLAAMISVAVLFLVEDSPEVLVVASDQRQSNITLRAAKRMIELAPELLERAHLFADKVTTPLNNGLLLPLPADPSALHGWDPTVLIVDELHVVTEAVWEAVTSMVGKRPRSLTLAISTPASSADSVMWRLIEHGRAGDDPAFYLREFAAPEGCNIDDREAWRIGNPAMSCERPFLAEDGMAAARRTLREPVFRQLRLGQWVTGSESWLPFGAWDLCKSEGPRVDRSTKVVLAFDGSASGDSTALVGCTVGPVPHLWVEGLWENQNERGWRVPREDVDNAVAVAFQKYNVIELAADPWGWRTEIESWAKRHGDKRVIEWNTAAAARMAPATDRLYQAVVTKAVTHDGDTRLAAHIAHCVAKRTPMGDLVSKDKKNSPRKIDAAVASIVALDRAAHHTQRSGRRVAGFSS